MPHFDGKFQAFAYFRLLKGPMIQMVGAAATFMPFFPETHEA